MTFKAGINTQSIINTATGQYWVNALNQWPSWQTYQNGGSGATNEEWNLNLDPLGCPISLSIGINGAALSANSVRQRINLSLGPYGYPGGSNSWLLQWTGSATWSFYDDITGTSSSSPTTLSPTASGNGMGIILTATGSSATVTTPAGTSVNWTGHGFAANTPVAFNSTSSVDTAIIANQVYYVKSPLTNSFQISATPGGGSITFNGNSVGTQNGFGNWARSIALIQNKTAHINAYNAGKAGNPDYVALYTGFSPVRFMQLMLTYQFDTSTGTNATFTNGGTNVNIPGFTARVGQSIGFVPSAGATMPSPLNYMTTYFIMDGGTSGNFRITTTYPPRLGTPITFNTAGATGTTNFITHTTMAASDHPPAGYLFGMDSSSGQIGPYSGPPIELLCKLCNELGSDLWLNIPPQADDSWITDTANRIFNTLNSTLNVYIELSNEIWNDFGWQTYQLWSERGYKLFPGYDSAYTARVMFMCYRSLRAFQIFQGVFPGTRMVRVIGGQQSYDSHTGNFYLPKFSTDYGGTAQTWWPAATHAYQLCDAYAPACYFTGLGGGNLPVAWSADADGGLAKFKQHYMGPGSVLPYYLGSGSWSQSPLTVGGTAAAMTVTTSNGYTDATIPNALALTLQFPIGNAAGATLQIDSCTPRTMVDFWGNTMPASGSGGIDWQYPNDVWVAVYTAATNTAGVPSSPVVSMLGGINYTGGIDNYYGIMAGGSRSVINSVTYFGTMYWGIVTYNSAAVNVAQAYGLRCVAYEAGQIMAYHSGQFQAANDTYVNVCNQINPSTLMASSSTQMGDVYAAYYNAIINVVGLTDANCHYCDSQQQAQSPFGLLLDTYQTPAPETAGGKYDAYYDLVYPDVGLTISPSSLPNGNVGNPYTAQTLTASGGTSPYTWTHTGTVPPGLTFTDSTATLDGGSPTTAGSFTFSVSVHDSASTPLTGGPQSYTVMVAGVIALSPTSLPNGTVGTAYNQTVTASGGASPYTYSITSGSLPPGLGTFPNSTGIISGTPSSQGTFSFTIHAVDGVGSTAANQSYTVNIASGVVGVQPMGATCM